MTVDEFFAGHEESRRIFDDLSPRWKQIVGPAPGRFTHHLELRSTAEIDDEVRAWLQEAWAAS